MTRTQSFAVGVIGIIVAVLLSVDILHRVFSKKDPDRNGPTVITQMREVARLETLDVRVYKKIDFTPDPAVPSSFWGEVSEWAKHALNPPRGRAIVFAEVHLGIDASKLTAESVRVHGNRVDVQLPPIVAQVELRPGETEVIGSNLDSKDTAALFELARAAFEREAISDEALKARARSSAERAIRAVLMTTGFGEVRFVEKLEGSDRL